MAKVRGVIIDVDIDVIEYLPSCSNGEINEIINWLDDAGFYTPHSKPIDSFDSCLMKLFGKRLSLTKEEEETIRKISKQF